MRASARDRWCCSFMATRRSGTSGRIRWPRWAAIILRSVSTCADTTCRRDRRASKHTRCPYLSKTCGSSSRRSPARTVSSSWSPTTGEPTSLGSLRCTTPRCWKKLIIINGAHPFISERELLENPAQRYASNYFVVFNKFLAPDEQPVDEVNTRESAVRRAHTGFVDAEVKSGRYTEADRQAWIEAWSQPGSTTAGLNYYRANHRNAPFNDLHPASTIPTSWSAKEVTQGAKSTIIKTPTLVIWGLKDTAILSGNLSGLDKWVTNLSVRLYPDDDHWVMMQKAIPVAKDIRSFIDDKNFPRDSVYRAQTK